jgi:uncharacterized protein YndB with AHSA1/START domain
VAAAQRIHRQGPSNGCAGQRYPQDVLHELIANERIRYTDTFDDPNLKGEMQVTISLKQVSCGTELGIAQEGLPEVIPLEACYLGWQESLALLAKLVEAEVPD